MTNKTNQCKQPMTRALSAAWIAPVLLALLGYSAAAQADTKVRASSFEYDASGLLIKEVIEPDSPNDCLQTSYTYDSYGNKTSVSTSACASASGYAVASASVARTASSSFGADGRFALSTTNALGQTETKAYDPRFGKITSLTGPNGLTTTWVYDGFGRKTRENRADGTYTTWAYLLCTDVGASCPGPIGGATVNWVIVEQSYAANGAVNAPEKRQFHDTLDRVVRVQTLGFDATGGSASAAPTLVQDTEYNALGQVARKSNLYALNTGTPYWASYSYDVLGRVASEQVTDPAAPGGVAVTTNSYNGLSTTTTNSKGQTKTITKNAQGQVAQVTDAQGNTISYSYDALGQLLSTNAAGSITTMSYNQRGQKVAMNDPAMGAWVYAYNAFGELVYQRDSLNQASTMAYDVLGRLVQRTEPDLISQWSYDKKFDNTACGKGVGKLCEAIADNGYRRTHSYDPLGRPVSTATVLDNPASPAVVSIGYDANTGRVANKTWPTGYQASYTYSALGYLSAVTGGGTNGYTQTVSYQVLAMNAQGQITQYRYGNQVTTVKTHDAATGRLMAQSATLDGQGSGNVLAQTYSYDSLGNLTARTDSSPGVGTQESFSYDSLNRLTNTTILGGGVSPPQTVEVLYDARGNIAYKSDVGRYWYDAARPNRMTNVTLETAPGAQLPLTGTRALSYVFDDYRGGAQSVGGTTVGNGNLEYTVSQDTANNLHTLRSESYTSFNMPKEIVYGNFITSTSSTADRTLSFIYGPEHQRIKQNVVLSGNGTSVYSAGNTWYLNGDDGLGLSFEKEVKANGTTENKHYVSAGGLVFAMFTSRSGNLNGKPATTTAYYHHDHLGSLAVITDESGAVTERLSYDPWGKRRYANGVPDTLDSVVGYQTDRGYTMHEHLDEIGVIHMNGRIYDPLIGRFMSADPFIQDPTNLQSYSRYAYVTNNPLALTDPTGYIFGIDDFIIAVAIIQTARVTGVIDNRTAGTLTSIATMAVLGPQGAFGTFAGGGMAQAAIAGFAGGVVGSGTFEGGVQGAFSAAMFSWAGDIGEAAKGGWQQYAAHAVAGCVTSAAGGGDCSKGAAAAVFGKYATNNIKIDDMVLRGVAAAVAGGVGSVIAGGKFENGASTAAFGYLFNELSHATFNRKSGQLYVRDADTGKEARGLFFSGTGSSDQIPAGDYAILQRGDKDGFRLEPYDSVFGNDKHDGTGQSLLRLHGPGRSNGCVTACDASGWAQVKALITNTATKQVEITRYKSITLPGGYLLGRIPVGTEKVNYYGRLKVE